MIEQYEQAVLEWFAAVYPRITRMYYGSIEEYLANEPTLIYPALIYKRVDDEQVLPKALSVDAEATELSTVAKSTFFQFPQVYEAQLYLNDTSDLFRVANILRQKWARESYVTLRYPTVDEQLRVGLRLYNFRLVTDRTGVDVKGPQRYIQMRWRSDLFYEAIEDVKRYTGYVVNISAGGTGEKFEAANTCCKDGSCKL